MKNDHRFIVKKCVFLHFHNSIKGGIFWHPAGWNLFQRLISYMRNKQKKSGYLEINTPEIMNKEIWKNSGHWNKFRDYIFIVTNIYKNEIYVLRPMNCPGAIEVFKRGIKTYKDLPLRFSEFGKVYRFEPSGSLFGLMRIRFFTQDDAHIFCLYEQIVNESLKVCDLIKEVYTDFTFNNFRLRFSDRPNKYLGCVDNWYKSEYALFSAIKRKKLLYSLNKYEGAFYGPKLEFILTDNTMKEWQLGTLQVDFNLATKMKSYYINNYGERKIPVILHRAIFGSIERFMGILLENFSGNLPLWISPTQIVLLTACLYSSLYIKKIHFLLQGILIRCIFDFSNFSIPYKINKYSFSKIPIIIIIGQKEEKNNFVSIRKIGNKIYETLELNYFIYTLLNNIKLKEF